MKPILQTPIIQDEKKWYFLSMFYAREKWNELVTNIMNFYRMHTGMFCNYLFSFSCERGEHLQVTFASIDINKDYTNDIQIYFKSFLEQFPSTCKTKFPYGKVIWGNYPNNSIVWNKFRIPNYSSQYFSFHQQTMRVALKLMDGDFSEENIFSVGLYLITKQFFCIDSQEQRRTISKMLNGFPNDIDTAKELLYMIDINEICEAIESYRNEDINKYSSELTSWLHEVKTYLKTINFNSIRYYIGSILGLTGLRQLMILELMNTWYNRQQDKD